MIDYGKYWAPDAVVGLCRVPWDSKYQDVVDWQTDGDVLNYFYETKDHASRISRSFSATAYHRTGGVLTLDIPYDECYTYNYVVVDSGSVPTNSASTFNHKHFYYFITNVAYQNPATSVLTLQLDVWTTFAPSMQLSTGFLDRGHVMMADRQANQAANVPSILASYYEVPEGIDTGSEFRNYATVPFSLQSYDGETPKDDWVIVMSTAKLDEDFGTIDNPKLQTAGGDIACGVFSGANIYAVPRSSFRAFITVLSSYSWVAQCIISITTAPHFIVGDLGDDMKFNLGGQPRDGVTCYYVSGAVFNDTYTSTTISLNQKIEMSEITDDGWSARTAPYKDLKKLWAYPYSAVQLTAYAGNEVNLKPQLFAGNETSLSCFGEFVQPFAQVAVFPWGYGAGVTMGDSQPGASNQHQYQLTYLNAASDSAETMTAPYGDFLQSALWISDFPQWSIVNNSYTTYLASTAHTRAYQYDSAAWSLKSADMSRRNTYDIAQQSLATTKYNQETGYIQSVGNGIIGAVSQLGTGNVLGAVGSLGGTAINTMAQYDVNQANNQLAQYVMDANNDLAASVNQGNYDNAVQGIQAGINDAALNPPSSVGQMGGAGMKYAFGLLFSGAIRYMRVGDDAIIRAGQYFKRYGYKTLRYVNIPQGSLNVMNHFTYWKFADLAIQSAMADETSKDALRGIFAKGVTVWKDPQEIGRILPQDNAVDESKMGSYLR